MTDLADFLLARIAEDEAVARAAVAHTRWALGDFDEPSVHGIAHASWENTDGDAWPNMVHIARHDPARVLAECEAKRRIVGEHASTDEGEFYPGSSVGSERIADDDEPFDLACVCCGEYSEYAVPWPCRTLRALAAVYAVHPEYREEWAL
jgi:hypothetical protein